MKDILFPLFQNEVSILHKLWKSKGKGFILIETLDTDDIARPAKANDCQFYLSYPREKNIGQLWPRNRKKRFRRFSTKTSVSFSFTLEKYMTLKDLKDYPGDRNVLLTGLDPGIKQIMRMSDTTDVLVPTGILHRLLEVNISHLLYFSGP